MAFILPTVLLILGLLLVRWGFHALDRAALQDRRGLRAALVGVPGVYLITRLILLITDWAGHPGRHIFLPFEASFLALLFVAWIATILAISLITARIVR